MNPTPRRHPVIFIPIKHKHPLPVPRLDFLPRPHPLASIRHDAYGSRSNSSLFTIYPTPAPPLVGIRRPSTMLQIQVSPANDYPSSPALQRHCIGGQCPHCCSEQ